METLTEFTRSDIKLINRDAIAALQAVAAEYGLAVLQTGGSFSKTEFRYRVVFTITDPTTVEQRERSDFDRLCGLFGLTPAHFKAVYINGGKTFQLVGFECSRRKYPLCMRGSDGEICYATRAAATRLLPTKPPTPWRKR